MKIVFSVLLLAAQVLSFDYIVFNTTQAIRGP